jgi:hypothetical protein
MLVNIFILNTINILIINKIQVKIRLRERVFVPNTSTSTLAADAHLAEGQFLLEQTHI